MKLSEMSTDRACDCMLALAEPIGNIVEDRQVVEAITDLFNQLGKITATEAAGQAVRKILPLALREHRSDVYQVLAALTGKTAAEIGAQSISQTISDAKGAFDRDLVDFFSSSAATAQSAASAL